MKFLTESLRFEAYCLRCTKMTPIWFIWALAETEWYIYHWEAYEECGLNAKTSRKTLQEYCRLSIVQDRPWRDSFGTDSWTLSRPWMPKTKPNPCDCKSLCWMPLKYCLLSTQLCRLVFAQRIQIRSHQATVMWCGAGPSRSMPVRRSWSIHAIRSVGSRVSLYMLDDSKH